jgi:L-aminopeptidase/D-esterase-like protein
LELLARSFTTHSDIRAQHCLVRILSFDVAETFDFLNDANGEHVKPAHALEALDRAKPGPFEEGAVGGGAGMVATDSRAVSAPP